MFAYANIKLRPHFINTASGRNQKRFVWWEVMRQQPQLFCGRRPQSGPSKRRPWEGDSILSQQFVPFLVCLATLGHWITKLYLSYTE